ncbi:MAG: class I SAM-dependent methyltransferase [Epsilonproteobacteria bacterium]|nr:class I SAM-dependent methyltransferase [Campylobacterota bacterium]
MQENEDAFSGYANEYDAWFDKHTTFYKKEMDCVKKLIGSALGGLDIGAGSGRFSLKPAIVCGVEPSFPMRLLAEKRGIHVVDGLAEKLPFEAMLFPFALMINSLCFIQNPEQALREAFRVLQKNGFLVVGFIDKLSDLGQSYEARKETSLFYRNATFFSREEVMNLALKVGFDAYRVEREETDFGMVFLKFFKPS